jgi:hypothetical protein
MTNRAWNIVFLGGFSLVLVGGLSAQQAEDASQRKTLIGIRSFAVHARVQVSERAGLEPLDETLLRGKLELPMRREGIVIQGPNDIRDGSAAYVSLLYVVVGIKDSAGQGTGFAASSCLQASQLVRIPRLSVGGRITYAVAPTWSSCAVLVGDHDSYRNQILQNADEQIARFLKAWRAVNTPPAAPPVLSNPELGFRESPIRAGEKLVR